MFFREEIHLSDEEIEDIGRKGYDLERRLGEGSTGDLYVAVYRQEGLKHRRGIKVQKHPSQIKSINTLLNMAKMDLYENEVVVSNDLRHPNILTVLDTFQIGERRCIVYEHFDASSLESRIKTWGRVEDIEKADSIFEQLIEPVYYMHEEKEMLHRDIKPGNVLINVKGLVKLGDTQNAKRVHEVIEKGLPTRGGTSYTHPELLNALITGEAACASKKSDIYALGATMLYTLTGKNPFDYQLVEDEEGTPIDLGGRTVRVSIRSKGEKTEKITKAEHNRRIKELLKEVPLKYRRMIRKMVSYDSGYERMWEVKRDFEKVKRSKYHNLVAGLKSFARVSGAVAVGSLALGFGLWLGIGAEEASPGVKSVEQLLRNRSYGYFGIKLRASNLEDGERMVLLKPYLDSSREKLEKCEEWNTLEDHLGYIAERGGLRIGSQRCNPRILHSIARACVTADKDAVEKAYGDSRYGHLLTPKWWWPAWHTEQPELPPENEQNRYGILTSSADYLNACSSVHDGVEDVIAKYFCTQNEIDHAKMRSLNRELLPSSAKTEFNAEPGLTEMELHSRNPVTHHGYWRYLPKHKKDLVLTAIAWYLVSDDEGKLKPSLPQE